MNSKDTRGRRVTKDIQFLNISLTLMFGFLANHSTAFDVIHAVVLSSN